jgi:Mg2+ and Co2+ transporter CorA
MEWKIFIRIRPGIAATHSLDANRPAKISKSDNMLLQVTLHSCTPQQLLPDLNWFDVPDPGSPDLDELARRFHLHELQIDDCRHRPQRKKVDEYGIYLFAVLELWPYALVAVSISSLAYIPLNAPR